jgi:copper ion binding protein
MALFGAKKNDITITVEGMSCGHCEKRVEEAVSAIAGVKGVMASHVKRSVVVSTKGAVSREAIVAAIGSAGYQVAE